jgi:signal transduction histidine kinase
MKSMIKILIRYVLFAAGVALILIIINFTALLAWTVQSSEIMKTQTDSNISQFADQLTRSENGFILSSSTKAKIKKKFQWAMLLNHKGRVIWSMNLPDDVPLKYSVSDVASFTHWYLNDYPVYVWRHPDGLFVLGCKKGSLWKFTIETPVKVLDNTLVWIPAILVLNGVAAILLSLLFGMHLFHSLQPLARGIETMAKNQPVELSTKGLLQDLAIGINKTSLLLTKQNAALGKRDSARTTWIAGVSHDIRTPLSLVMGYASQLENDTELPQSKRDQAGIIRKQSERIKTLINDLNLASKLEYDMQPIWETNVTLSALLRSVAADFFNNGLDHGYSIDVIIQENAQNIKISGDEGLLKRAVSNLITNSIRHNPDGCEIKITLERNQENCFLFVSDNGIGFTQEILCNLNHSLNAAQLGEHGLGLTIVRQIVKEHGGTTKFQNIPEGGCMVTLCFPCK